jgi:hypothetical protein
VEKLIHSFDFLLGDPSDDGHGITENVSVLCNRSPILVQEAYRVALRKGYPDLIKDGACEYEEPWLTADFTRKFFVAMCGGPSLETFDHVTLCNRILGFTKFEDADEARQIAEIVGIHDYDQEFDPDDEPNMDQYDFVMLYMFICRAGDPTIEFDRDTKRESIDIGGYGLFQ